MLLDGAIIYGDLTPRTPDQAVQRTASQSAFHFVSVCHLQFPCVARYRARDDADKIALVVFAFFWFALFILSLSPLSARARGRVQRTMSGAKQKAVTR